MKRVIEDVRLFDGLQEHAGWHRLAEKIRAGRKGFLDFLTAELWAGREVDQRRLDYTRGFYEGASYVIEMPAKAESSLEQAAREAWRLTQIEAAQEAENASPYLDDPTGGE